MDAVKEAGFLTQKDKEERGMILAGVEQVRSRQTKDFQGVCERLTGKYRSATISDRDH